MGRNIKIEDLKFVKKYLWRFGAWIDEYDGRSEQFFGAILYFAGFLMNPSNNINALFISVFGAIMYVAGVNHIRIEKIQRQLD